MTGPDAATAMVKVALTVLFEAFPSLKTTFTLQVPEYVLFTSKLIAPVDESIVKVPLSEHFGAVVVA